jgi:signal transduction histidine kinase
VVLVVSITDNGRGLAASSLRRRGSLGLIGMRESAAALGGNLEILPHSPTGTTVQALFPLASLTPGGPGEV